jgi:hypothetical protein
MHGASGYRLQRDKPPSIVYMRVEHPGFDPAMPFNLYK